MLFSKKIKEKIKEIHRNQTNLILGEFLAVITGVKPVLTAGFSKEGEEDLIKSNFPELFLSCSKKTIAGSQVKVCAISRVKSLAEETMECFCKEGDGNRTGELLGYPDCCVEKYNPFIGNSLQYHSPLITHQSFRKTKNFSFLTNNLFNFSSRLHTEQDLDNLKEFRFLNEKLSRDLQFISHIPCDYSCEKSIEIGKSTNYLLKEYDSQMEKIIREVLSRPVLFLGLFESVVFDGNVKDGVLFYNKILPPYFPMAMRNPFIKYIITGNRIIVSEKEINIFKNKSKLFSYRKKSELDGLMLNFKDDAKD